MNNKEVWIVEEPDPNKNSEWCDHSAWMTICIFCGAVLEAHDEAEYEVTTVTGTDVITEYGKSIDLRDLPWDEEK